jgi:hypothetical protein
MNHGVVLTHCYVGDDVQLIARFYLDGQFITKAVVLQAPTNVFNGLDPRENTLEDYQNAVENYNNLHRL